MKLNHTFWERYIYYLFSRNQYDVQYQTKIFIILNTGSKLVFWILRLILGYLRIRMLLSDGISDWNSWIIRMSLTLLTKFRPENNYKKQQNETEDAEVQTITSSRQVIRSEFCQIASKWRIPKPSGCSCFLTILNWTSFFIRIKLSIIILSLSEMWVIISSKGLKKNCCKVKKIPMFFQTMQWFLVTVQNLVFTLSISPFCKSWRFKIVSKEDILRSSAFLL